MFAKSFPACCTAKVLVDFGESTTAEYGNHSVSAAHLREDLQLQIRDSRDMGMACLVATTNNQQKTANKVLREAGFKCTKWMRKEAHPETKLRLWWFPLFT